MEFKRIVVISDTHCGSRVGLTPTKFDHPPVQERDNCWHEMRGKQWNWFSQTITALREQHSIDYLFHLGDAVEGPGECAKGRDVVWPQREDQITIAEAVINFVQARKIWMVTGTPYHVDNWEIALAEKVGAKIKSRMHINVNGVMFDLRHKIGKSANALTKARVNNILHHCRDEAPDSDIILRGHVHYYSGVTQIGRKSTWYAYTLPALQGPGTLFGLEQCEGLVDFGFMHFDVYESGEYSHRLHWARFVGEEPEVDESKDSTADVKAIEQETKLLPLASEPAKSILPEIFGKPVYENGIMADCGITQEPPMEQKRLRRQDYARIKLIDIISAKILSVPIRLFRKYKGQVLEATLCENGAVDFRGTRYYSCSDAANMSRQSITGQKMSTNGWAFWQYEDAGGCIRTLENARNKYMEKLQPNPDCEEEETDDLPTEQSFTGEKPAHMKPCPTCGGYVGPRTLVCKHCHNPIPKKGTTNG